MNISLRKDTVILDLDHTLIHTVPSYELSEKDRVQADIHLGGYCVFLRPYLGDFLNFCFQKYKRVILWSRGGHEYVHTVVQNLESMGMGTRRFHKILTYAEYPIHKDVKCKQHIDININRTIFLDDLPKWIIGLPPAQVYEATPFYYYDRNNDTYLCDIIEVFKNP